MRFIIIPQLTNADVIRAGWSEYTLPEDALDSWLPTECPAKILMRQGDYAV